MEIVFEVMEEEDGGYSAAAVGYGIFTQGDDWADLEEMAWEAALCYFDDDEEKPETIRLNLVKEEVAAI